LNKYEVLYILQAEQDEEAIAAQVAKYGSLVADNGGTVDEISQWGKRRLAYPINYRNDGYYVLMNFTAEPGFTAELERNFRNDENVMRFMVIRKDD
jgi:small subunit ribosomal protein S6